MSDVLLDASALLALFNREAGADWVAALLPRARVATLNLAEVVGKLTEHGVPAPDLRRSVSELAIGIEPFTKEMAFVAGGLRAATKGAGLSLGDRGCLACAQVLGLKAVTADHAWKRLNLDVEIQLIR